MLAVQFEVNEIDPVRSRRCGYKKPRTKPYLSYNDNLLMKVPTSISFVRFVSSSRNENGGNKEDKSKGDMHDNTASIFIACSVYGVHYVN
jgi:hypothetical protein